VARRSTDERGEQASGHAERGAMQACGHARIYGQIIVRVRTC
jgi:hypothetical protein